MHRRKNEREKKKKEKQGRKGTSILKVGPEGTTGLRTSQLSSWYTYKRRHTHTARRELGIIVSPLPQTGEEGRREKDDRRFRSADCKTIQKFFWMFQVNERQEFKRGIQKKKKNS